MTDLSPQAQAIVNAAVDVTGYGKETQILKDRLAAALYALADRVVPEEDPPADFLDHPVAAEIDQRRKTRAEILAIAAELEGVTSQ